MEQVVKRMIEMYLKQKGLEKNFYQHPAFDLIDQVYEKILEETDGIQEAVFDCVKQYCCSHIEVNENVIVYQETLFKPIEQECCISPSAYYYELLPKNRLSKTKINISTDFMEQDKDFFIKNVTDFPKYFLLEYKKEQYFYNECGIEWHRIIRSYPQWILKKFQLQRILLSFPIDPDIWNMPFFSEIQIKRTQYLNTAFLEFLIPSVAPIPYVCEYGLQMKKPNDLLHLELSNPSFLDLVLLKLCNHAEISKEGIKHVTDEERTQQMRQLWQWVRQLPNEQAREYFLNYIQKEPTYDSDMPLKMTIAKSL